MNDRRWTLDPDINEFMETFNPPADLLEELGKKYAPVFAAAPKPGDSAPDFEVEQLTSDGRRSGENVSCTDYRGKPLALLFGSYTCPIYRGQLGRLNEIYTEMKDRFQFLNIYTPEAHPEDGWQLDINHSQDVVYEQARSADERAEVAQTCMQKYRIEMPIAIDGMDNAVSTKYAGAPERLYIIDADGKITYRSVNGPFQMNAIEDWQAALERYPD